MEEKGGGMRRKGEGRKGRGVSYRPSTDGCEWKPVLWTIAIWRSIDHPSIFALVIRSPTQRSLHSAQLVA